MRRLLAILALAVSVVVVLVLSTRGPEDDGVPPAPADLRFPVGLSFGDRLRTASDLELGAALDDVVALNASWVRIDLSWTVIQPDSALAYDWRATDRIVDAARKRNLEVLGILTYTPPWARVPGCTGFACPPRLASDFARFAKAAAARYGPRRIAAYEIWNEPNLAQFWVSPDPAAYRDLLAASIASIRAADPSATVLLGGLAANQAGAGVIEAPRFLSEVCSTGACRTLDGVGYHPYTFPQTAFAHTSERTSWQRITQPSAAGGSLRSILAADGAGRAKIWVTEYGAPSADGVSSCPCVSEAAQAAIVSSGVRAAVAARTRIGAIFIYTWMDLGSGASIEDHFGLRRLDGSRKPAFGAMARAAARE